MPSSCKKPKIVIIPKIQNSPSMSEIKKCIKLMKMKKKKTKRRKKYGKKQKCSTGESLCSQKKTRAYKNEIENLENKKSRCKGLQLFGGK